MHRINRYWREGRYVDLWSINHVLSGVVLGSLLWNFGMPWNWSLLLAIVLFIGWEVVEILTGIKEHAPNMVTDVVCDMAGFLLTAWWYAEVAPFSWTAVSAWILVFTALNIWGFIAYEERKIESKKVANTRAGA